MFLLLPCVRKPHHEKISTPSLVGWDGVQVPIYNALRSHLKPLLKKLLDQLNFGPKNRIQLARIWIEFTSEAYFLAVLYVLFQYACHFNVFSLKTAKKSEKPNFWIGT